MHIKEKNKVLLVALFISISAHASGLYLLWPAAAQNTWVRPGKIQVNVIAYKSKQSNIKKMMDHANSDSGNLPGTNNYQEKGYTNSSDVNNIPNSTANQLTIQLRGKIKTALQEHLTYPPIARRRGWQGTVTIRVTIKGNGNLQQIKLAKSSGYSLLDRSAIMALKKVRQLSELRPLLQGRAIPIELPITYLLKDPANGTPSV